MARHIIGGQMTLTERQQAGCLIIALIVFNVVSFILGFILMRLL